RRKRSEVGGASPVGEMQLKTSLEAGAELPRDSSEEKTWATGILATSAAAHNQFLNLWGRKHVGAGKADSPIWSAVMRRRLARIQPRQATAMFSSRQNSLLKWKLHRDNVAADGPPHDLADLFKFSRNVTRMTLKSAFEDLSRTTLEALNGCLRRLEYLAGLKESRGEYSHWGFSKVYGEQPARKALTAAHRTAVSQV